MPTPPSSSLPLIKGYLPVRLRLPRQPKLLQRGESDDNGDNTEVTYFFVREHQGKVVDNNDSLEATSKRGTSLFIANAPVIPGVSTKLLLKSIFCRFADVARVTAVQNPRAAYTAVANEDGESSALDNTTSTKFASPSSFVWSNKEEMFQPTFLPHILSPAEGKYAHVVFSSSKGMKKAKKELENLMSNSSSRRRIKKKAEENEMQQPALVLDKLEVQTLSDESLRQRKETIAKTLKRDCFDDASAFDSESDIDENPKNMNRKHAGVLAVAERYRESCKFLKSRSNLMKECNAVMQAYEDAEEQKRRATEAAKATPDDDGFITVSYSNAVGSKVEFEQSATATTPSRRKGNKRSRKRKETAGSVELKDFYRFQRADNRKRTMEDLRRKFEEDVRKVKRLKEEKEYRPF